jgi:hypothetical protein
MLDLIEKIYAANPSIDQIYESTQFDPDSTSDLIAVVTKIITWIYYFGGVLIFIYLLISGITLMTAGGNAEQAKKGTQGIIYGTIGVVVMVLAAVLVKVASYIASNNAPMGQ